jgi:MFS transporter, FSR family, fosmidomycin resistance protein
MLSREARVNLLIGTGHFLSHFYQLCLPPLFLAWQQQFDVSFADLGLAPVVLSTMAALLQTPYGFAIDRFGARWLLIANTVVMSATIALMAAATAYWQIVVLATISGAANAVFHPADYSILTGSISKERMGRAFAIHTFTGNAGMALAPPLVTVLMLVMGWRTTLLVIGLAGLPVAAAILWQSSILHDHSRGAKKAGGMTVRSLLFDRTLLLFFMFYLLGAMASGGVQAWLITILNHVKGLELAVASSTLTAYMVGAGAGVLLGGWTVERFRSHVGVVVAALTAFSAVLVLLLALIPLTGAIAMSLMFASGVALGASRTPRDIMLTDASPPGDIGKVFGFVSSGLPLGAALTPVPFGYLMDHGGGNWVLVAISVLLVASIFCMGTARTSAKAAAQAPAAEAT